MRIVVVLWVGVCTLCLTPSPADAAPGAGPTDLLATSPAAAPDALSGTSPRAKHASGPRLKYRWPRWIPWVILGAGVVLAGVGTPLIFLSRGDYVKYDNRWSAWCQDPLGCPTSERPTSLSDLEQRAKAERLSGFTLLSLGGTLVITGLVLALLNKPRIITSKQAQAIEPPRFVLTAAPLPGGAAVMTYVRF